jgi:hypothetical protein
VLKHNGEYYAYGTLPELTIPVLHSRDLVSWRPLGDALALHDGAFAALWAPEVAYDNGTFYMYYSAGGEEGEGHQLRVATATRPSGPFEDSGVVLTPDDPFTIDAHPFRDDDGQWYLYYCRDFLDSEGGERVGTGIVVDGLIGMTRLAGERRTVVLWVDGARVASEIEVPAREASVGLLTYAAAAAFAGTSVTLLPKRLSSITMGDLARR